MKKQTGDARGVGDKQSGIGGCCQSLCGDGGCSNESGDTCGAVGKFEQLMVAQALPMHCSLFDASGCKQQDGGSRASGGVGVAAAAGLGATSSSGSQNSNGSGTSSPGSVAAGLGTGSAGSGSGGKGWGG